MSLIQFAPAGSISQQVMGPSFRAAMPAVDGANPDTTIQAVGTAQPIWVRLGGNVGDPPLQCDASTMGVIRLDPGIPQMFTSNAAVVAAGVGTGRVVNDRGAAAAATSFCVAGMMSGGQVVITRGTATPTITF